MPDPEGEAAAARARDESPLDGVMARVDSAAAAQREDEAGPSGPSDAAQLDGLLSEYLQLVTSDPDREIAHLAPGETEGGGKTL